MRGGGSISFCAEVKDELARVWPEQGCDRRSELAGLVRACGALELAGAGKVALALHTDTAAVARKALKLLHQEYGLRTEVMAMRRSRLRKNLAFNVRVPAQAGVRPLLAEAGILDDQGRLLDAVPVTVPERECCTRAYLRGMFLGAGWVSHPERSHHLEMVCPGPALADALGQALFRFGLPVRVAARKDALVLYLKEGEQVARFLGLAGAHGQMLRYEDVRVLKEMKNRINREINAETANLQKTVEAAARQVEAIRRLAAAGGLLRLPPALQELAQLRLKHPEASLVELGQLCQPPVGKSGVNHRMRELLRRAGGPFPGADT